MSPSGRVNRTQAIVIGFFFFALIGAAVTLVFSPAVYADSLRLAAGDRLPVELAFLAALSVFILLLAFGVIRRWRWTFWLVFVAFIFGVIRVPASILEITGVLPKTGPTWYVLLQGAIGLAQFAIALALLRGYRKAGVWGAF